MFQGTGLRGVWRSSRAQEEALRVRPVVPVGLETDYVELMQQCWSTDKDRRPGMSAVVARLRQILRRLGQPAPKDTQRAEEVRAPPVVLCCGPTLLAYGGGGEGADAWRMGAGAGPGGQAGEDLQVGERVHADGAGGGEGATPQA